MKRKITNYSAQICLDEYFGQLSYMGKSKWEFTALNTGNYFEKSNSRPLLIILLESPHISEFNSSGAPLGPAKGATGTKLKKYLPSVLTNSCSSNQPLNNFLNTNHSTINVLICNSVQKQCSMGITPISCLIKETNWIDEWASKNTLVKRLKSYTCFIKAGKTNLSFHILNLCTKGICIPMQELVTQSLLNAGFNKTCISIGPHPSSWRNKNKIILKAC